LIAQQAKQDIERLESARTFIAFLEKVEIEESSRRGLLTLRLPTGESEPIRTEQKDTDRGHALILITARSGKLTGAAPTVSGGVGFRGVPDRIGLIQIDSTRTVFSTVSCELGVSAAHFLLLSSPNR